MKKAITILIALIWTNNLFGQVQKDINDMLAGKDFAVLKKYVDSLSENEAKGDHWKCYWKHLRDLTPGYKEGIFYFSNRIRDRENPDNFTFNEFRVKLIANTNTIIYYEYTRLFDENDSDNDFEIIDTFKNARLYARLLSGFKKNFGADLNPNELFLHDFVYGKRCGAGGIAPDGRIEINRFVKRKDKASLLKWLQSTNTEKQVYAVDGLLQLKKRGVRLTSKELVMIKVVINKNGTIYSCSYCDYGNDEIRDITKNFRF